MVQEDMACPMTKGERILVAVDSSKYSDVVVDQAISMGRICNSVIYAVSVIELYAESVAIAPEVEEKMAQEVRAILEKIKQKVEAENIVCETIVRTDGLPHVPIIEEAQKRDIDLIVMGTRGKTRLTNILMGSVAQRVIGNSPCPVMVVPV